MECELCGTTVTKFIKVNHPVHGIIRICEECYLKEHDVLLPLPDDANSGCCGR